MAESEHQADLHRDLTVEGASADLDRLTEKLKVASCSSWTRDTEAERWYAGRGGGRDEPLVFASVGAAMPRAALWLFRKPDEVHVSNIVPREKSSLSHKEYNALIVSFAEELLGPAVEQTAGSLRLLLGPTTLTLEDALSPDSAQALRSFSGCANKSTGKGHPYDRERWNNFVVAAYDDGAQLDWQFLQDWLVADGWDAPRARRLADSYSDQVEILRHRRPVLVPGSSSDWDAALSVLRALNTVIVLDACAVLDVLRLPTRADASGARRQLLALRTLVRETRVHAPTLALAAPTVLVEELARNRSRVASEVEADLLRASRFTESLAACAEVLGQPIELRPTEAVTRPLDLLGEAVANLEQCWISLPITAEVRHNAYERSSRGRPPASRGKEALADCAVTEVALHLARTLPATRTRVILLSSNTKDFGQPGLEDELSDAGIAYCRTWEHAQHVAMNQPTEPTSS